MNLDTTLMPPHSIEAEQSVLGAILLEGSTALDRIEGEIVESDFYRPEHRRIFAGCCKLANLGRPVDVITVSEILEADWGHENAGVVPYLSSLAQNAPVLRTSGFMRKLAKELNIPIIALAQLNRSTKTRQDKRPQLSDLRDSGEIEQDADIVVMLHREDLSNPAPEWRGIAELIIRKNRNGPLGEVILALDGPTMKFTQYSGPHPRQQVVSRIPKHGHAYWRGKALMCNA